jgi:hypothetical protein
MNLGMIKAIRPNCTNRQDHIPIEAELSRSPRFQPEDNVLTRPNDRTL